MKATSDVALRPHDALVSDLDVLPFRHILLCEYRGVKYTVGRLTPGNVVVRLLLPQSDIADFASDLNHDGEAYILDGANDGEYPQLGPQYWMDGSVDNVEDGLVYRTVNELREKCKAIIDHFILLYQPDR